MEGKNKILLVDDNVSLCRSMSFILKRKGYEIAIAKDGLQAIDMAGETPYDMIFMDIKMPVLNGAETHERIRMIQPDAVVLMMTAYADEDLIEKALIDGAYGIVNKPLEIEKIFNLIDRATTPREGINLLVVEEEPELADKLKRLLSRNNNSVSLALDGKDALDLAAHNSFDLALVDMDLLENNALEVSRLILEDDPEATVILMTADRIEKKVIMERALNDFAYTCLYKPLDMVKVLDLVAEVGDKKQLLTA